MSAPRLPHRSRPRLHAVLQALPLAAALWLLMPGVAFDISDPADVKPARAEYVRSPQEWRWLPGALDALRLFRQRGYQIMVVTNQPGLARGVMTAGDLALVHERLQHDRLAAAQHVQVVAKVNFRWG